MEEEETKFKTADADQDGKLGLGEFAAIINPYHFDHMARLEVEHVRKQYDVDGDGQISRDEYLNFGLEGRQDTNSQEFKDQQQALGDQFDAFDADKSGTLDLSEIKEWVAPGTLSTSPARLLPRTWLTSDREYSLRVIRQVQRLLVVSYYLLVYYSTYYTSDLLLSSLPYDTCSLHVMCPGCLQVAPAFVRLYTRTLLFPSRPPKIIDSLFCFAFCELQSYQFLILMCV